MNKNYSTKYNMTDGGFKYREAEIDVTRVEKYECRYLPKFKYWVTSILKIPVVKKHYYEIRFKSKGTKILEGDVILNSDTVFIIIQEEGHSYKAKTIEPLEYDYKTDKMLYIVGTTV